MNRNSHTENRSSGRISRLFKLAILLTMLGCLWVWRISMYENVTRQELKLEEEGNRLLCDSDILLQKLLMLSDRAEIEHRAQVELSMRPLAGQPDTVWIPSASGDYEISTMSLLRIPIEE